MIVGEGVSQDRGLSTLQALADTLPPAQRYTSDGHAAYAELIWPGDSPHLVSRGKEETHTIESVNANLRTYLILQLHLRGIETLAAPIVAAPGVHLVVSPPV